MLRGKDVDEINQLKLGVRHESEDQPRRASQ